MISEIQQYAFLILLSVIVLIMLIILIKVLKEKRNRTFKSSFNDIKLKHEVVIVDMDEKSVDKYYPYSQNKDTTKISLEAFLMRFDKTNADKLRIWFDHISRNKSSKKVNKIEIIMYNEANERRVYLLEAIKYSNDPKRFYIDFVDVTESIQTIRRLASKNINVSVDDFIEQVNNRNSSINDNSVSYVAVIKYKEYIYTSKEISKDYIKLLDDAIYKRIISKMNEEDYLTKSNEGTILLYSKNINKVRKYKNYLKSLINKCSGTYDLYKGKYSYFVTLVGGFKKLDLNGSFSKEDILQIESAANKSALKGFLADKVQEFDEVTKKEYEVATNKSIIIDKVIQRQIVDIKLLPIINRVDKVVDCYYLKTVIPHSLNIGYTDFVNLVRARNYTFKYYETLFAKFYNDEKNHNKKIILSFDSTDLNEVLKAYRSKEIFANIDVTLFLEFPNRGLSNDEANSLLSLILDAKKENNIKFGININSLNNFYLNDDIFNSANYLLLSSQMIKKALDSYQNELALEVCLKEAKDFNLEVIAIDVSTLAMYETLAFHKINFIGGNLFNEQIYDEKITDRLFLESLKEAESKKY